MEECIISVRIESEDKIRVEAQIELINLIRTRLAEVLPEDTKLLVSRKVGYDELMNILK